MWSRVWMYWSATQQEDYSGEAYFLLHCWEHTTGNLIQDLLLGESGKVRGVMDMCSKEEKKIKQRKMNIHPNLSYSFFSFFSRPKTQEYETLQRAVQLTEFKPMSQCYFLVKGCETGILEKQLSMVPHS